MKKRIFSIVLAFLMVLAIMPTSALAVHTSDIETDSPLNKIINMLTGIECSKESWGLSDVDFCNLQIGNPIHSYLFLSESFKENAKLYPIFEDNRLLLWAIDCDNMITITTDLVNEIRDIIKTEEPFSLVYDRYGCYICTSNCCKLLTKYENDAEIESRSILTSEIAYTSEDIVLTELSGSNTVLQLPHTSSYAAEYIYSCNVPSINQLPDQNICWAACIASIVNYKTGRTLTAKDVAQRHYGYDYNATLNISYVPGILSLYGVNYLNQPMYPSDYTIYMNLIGGNPLYSRWVSSETTTGHACVIFGINTSKSGGILSIMDPWGGVRRTADFTGNGYAFYHPVSGRNYFLKLAVLKST